VEAPISKFEYQRMALILSFRDIFSPPQDILAEALIKPGDRVLDYGCGSGSFTFAAAQLVGPEGKVFAVDLHPLALQKVQRIAARRGLANIETIQTGCTTRLESQSIDVVLFYYVLHWLTAPDCVLSEFHRLMKPDALLSFRDPYMKEDEILARITRKGLFRLAAKRLKTYRFAKLDWKQGENLALPGSLSPIP
jgi:ubiquinone/menaquinone biosynthesis C-methylase UbiE